MERIEFEEYFLEALADFVVCYEFNPRNYGSDIEPPYDEHFEVVSLSINDIDFTQALKDPQLKPAVEQVTREALEDQLRVSMEP